MSFFCSIRKESGISLIEVMIAVAIASTAFAWINHNQLVSVQSINDSTIKTRVVTLLQELSSRVSMNINQFDDYESMLNDNSYSCNSVVQCIGRECEYKDMVIFDIQQVLCGVSDIKDLSTTLSCLNPTCDDSGRAIFNAEWSAPGGKGKIDNAMEKRKVSMEISW